MDELRHLLDEFDEWFRSERPDLYPRFRPGLPQDEIHALEDRLAPYRLPAELVTLYQWHDGWAHYADDTYVSLMWDADFNSLGEAVGHYESMAELMRDHDDMPDLWHPLWFPAFGMQHFDFVELQPEPNRPAGVVWSWHTHGGEVWTAYDSVISLFATTLNLWRAQLLPTQWSEGAGLQVRDLVASLNPETRRPDGPLYRELSRFPTLNEWPDEWLIAAGVSIPTPAVDAEVITLAQLLADPWCGRPVRGAFRYTAGGPGVGFGVLSDETAAVQIEADRESTENFRLLWPSPCVEMILTPITEGETVDEALADTECDDPLEASLTRRFLEATAASFHAERVVPLPATEPQDA